MKFASALVVAAALGVACHRDEPVTAPTAKLVEHALPADLSIELERTWCLGSCPTYTVKIDANGLVTWNGLTYVDAKGAQSSRIPVESVRELLARFDALAFTTLHDRYDVAASDIDGAFITLRREGTTKRVLVRGADMVGELFGSIRVSPLVWDDSQDDETEQLPGVHVFDDLDEEPASAEVVEQQQEDEITKYSPTFHALDDLATAIDKAANTAQWIGSAPQKQHR